MSNTCSCENAYPIRKLTLNGSDISLYKVVCPADAEGNVLLAKNELIRYIELTCGAKLEEAECACCAKHAIVLIPETVVVPNSPNANLDNFSIKSEGDKLIIRGSAERGLMFGVYDFIEEYIGWVFMHEGHDYLSPREELDLSGIDNTESPIFETRTNYWSTHLLSADMRNRHKIVSKPWTGGACHTFEYLSTTPDGRMLSEQFKSQPCLSDPEVYTTMRDKVMKLLAENPDAQLISISQNDNNIYCRCEKCAAVDAEEDSPAGSVLRFVNRIAEEIEQAGYKNVLVHTFAYMYSRKAPKITKPRHNVMIQLCSLECCFTHPLDGGCEEMNAPFAADIKDWSEISDTLYIWDYNNNFAYRGTPFPNFKYEVLAGNIRFFANHKVKGIFSQGDGGFIKNGEFDHLRAYLLAKLLWDPYMSEEQYNAYIDKFMEGFYGAGWKKIREAFDYWLSVHTVDVGIYDDPKPTAKNLAPHIPKLLALFEEAKAMAQTDYHRDNIDCSQIQFDYIELEACFTELYESGDEAKRRKAIEMSEALQAKFQKYGVPFSDSYKTPHLTEFTLPPSEWKALIDAQLEKEAAANQ